MELTRIDLVTQCESEPQDIEPTTIVATLYSNARAITLTDCKLTGKFFEKEEHCSQVSNEKKTDSILNLFSKII